MTTKAERRALLMHTVTDLVSNLLYYDRKEDEELPRGAIEEMVENGEVTPDEIVAHFAKELREGLEMTE